MKKASYLKLQIANGGLMPGIDGAAAAVSLTVK